MGMANVYTNLTKIKSGILLILWSSEILKRYCLLRFNTNDSKFSTNNCGIYFVLYSTYLRFEASVQVYYTVFAYDNKKKHPRVVARPIGFSFRSESCIPRVICLQIYLHRLKID